MRDAGKPGDGFVVERTIRFDCLKIGFVVYVADIHAERLGSGNNVAHGEQLGDIVARFVGHTQVFVGRFEPLGAGAVDGASDVAFTPVVGGKGKRPVAEQSIEVLQIVECGIGGGVNVVPAVVNRCFSRP